MSEIRNILYIHQSAGGGGASKCLGEYIEYFNKAGYTVVVIFGENGPLVNLCKKLGIKYHILSLSAIYSISHSPKQSLRKIYDFLINILPNIIKMYKIIKQERINLVHINSSIQIVSGIAAYFAKVRVVWHIREIILNNFIGNLQVGLIKKISSKIICISNEVAKVFQGAESNKVEVVYDGVDLQELNPSKTINEIKNDYKLYDEKIFLHLGQLFPEKGSFVFVKAAKILVDLGYNVKFFVLGGELEKSDKKTNLLVKIKSIIKKILGKDGLSWKERLEKFVNEQGLKDKFVFTGFINDVSNFINLADAIVSPHCVSEPFGLTLIEAGAFKKPVISTILAPTPEIVIHNETGILVEPNNPEAVSKAMEYIINNPKEAIRMGVNGFDRVLKKFKLQYNLNKVDEVYRSFFKIVEV